MNALLNVPEPDRERLLSKIIPEPMSGCWLWCGGSTNIWGYGLVYWKGKLVSAHRLIYMLERGPIPRGLTLDHLCRVRFCVNPDHLEPVTQQVNTLRSPITPSAINARKTHCLRGGHPLEGENLKIKISFRGKPLRSCRTCERELRHLLYLRTGR